MKLYINPQYEHLRDDILSAIGGNYVASKVFCHKRNIVEKFSMSGKEYVIKIYKRPNLCNRIAYTYFRKSKAERAYRHALQLQELGIGTPTPVAYAIKKKKGLFSTGYFISEYREFYGIQVVPYTRLAQVYKGTFKQGMIPICAENPLRLIR